jgi:hypothetical protein
VLEKKQDEGLKARSNGDKTRYDGRGLEGVLEKEIRRGLEGALEWR